MVEDSTDHHLVLLPVQVDCTANSGTCTKYGVSGYPTLKIFRGGALSGDYAGPRQAGTSVITCVCVRACVRACSMDHAHTYLGTYVASIYYYYIRTYIHSTYHMHYTL